MVLQMVGCLSTAPGRALSEELQSFLTQQMPSDTLSDDASSEPGGVFVSMGTTIRLLEGGDHGHGCKLGSAQQASPVKDHQCRASR